MDCGMITLPSTNLCLFGASPDTGNQGVTALYHAVIAGLGSRGVRRLALFDYGRQQRSTCFHVGDAEVVLDRHGAVNTRRIYRIQSQWMLRMAVRAGFTRHPGAKAFLEADAILDASAGDSFTDLYGARRFQSVLLPKLLALRNRIPLILLPQTFGPFRSSRSLRVATKVVRAATMVWARDEQSYSVVRRLTGDAFDPSRHRCGVDMAFLLPAHRPATLPTRIGDWLSEADEEQPVVGFNVSGLIFNDAASAASRFGLRTDYPRAVGTFLAELLERTRARVVLVPHVLTAPGHPESDVRAAEQVRRQLGEQARDRVEVLPPDYSPAELKWIIGQMSWFCGTRMHSTIAGLSSGVPTVALSYSIKTAGVFRTCQMGDCVLELRGSTTSDVVRGLLKSWQRRQAVKQRLAMSLPKVRQAATDQMDEIVKRVTEHRVSGEQDRAS